MVSLKSNTKAYFLYRDQAARFVEGLLEHSKLGLPLTMTITPEKYGDYSVQIVTGELSDASAANSEVLRFYDEHLSILKGHTQDG